MTTRASVERIQELYGAELTGPAGILHVTALWRTPSGPPRVLRINEATPPSPTDFFALCLARARAEAIVTTGKILRDEPGLVHSIPTTAPELSGLVEWREQRLGLKTPPLSVVLSSGRGLDLHHPLFERGRCLVFTSEEGASKLAAGAEERGVELAAHAKPSLRQLLRFLCEERGLGTVSIEAGPSSARELYSSPLCVDELMLSFYEEPELPAEAIGPPFLEIAELERHFPVAAEPVQLEEPSGRWTFQRRIRG